MATLGAAGTSRAASFVPSPTLDMPRAVDALPRLRLASSVLDVSDGARAQHVRPTVITYEAPPSSEGQAMWMAAGASAVLTLGSHVLIGLPVLALGGGLASSVAFPVLGLPVFLGVGGGYLLLQTALSALASTIAFNVSSERYEADWGVAFGAHLAGSMVGAAAAALPLTAGLVLLGGAESLASFTGGVGLDGLRVLSLLGALPAVIIAAVAIVAVPALVSSWALATRARPKAGYAFPAGTGPAPTRAAPTSNTSNTSNTSGAVSSRAPEQTAFSMTFALPGT